MKSWNKRSTTVLALAAGLILIGALAGYVVLAQDPEPDRTKGIEGTAGETGQILNMTSQQVQAIQAQDATVLYHFTGALNRSDPTKTDKATVVQCTNVHHATPTEIEVQLLNYNASAVYTGSVASVAPLHTATFESIDVAFYSADVILDAGFLQQGYGRILTDHDQVVCTAQAIDPDNDPPTWSLDLPLYIGPFHSSFLPAVLNHTAP